MKTAERILMLKITALLMEIAELAREMKKSKEPDLVGADLISEKAEDLRSLYREWAGDELAGPDTPEVPI